MTDDPLAVRVARAFSHLPPEEGHAALDHALDTLTTVELAAVTFDYVKTWARPKQVIPRQTPGAQKFRSWGFLTGRAFGKTWSISTFIVDEVLAGRAMRIALMAQTETKTEEVMVWGESGLVAMSPPWCKPEWINGRLLWPNGAQAFVYTPLRPDDPRGPEHHIGWISELPSWPKTKRHEAFMNVSYGVRIGYAITLWDCTPKRRDPLIRRLLKRVERSPAKHKVTRGHSKENTNCLNREKLQELEEEYGGTQQGKEELEGVFLDDDEHALWKDKWIEKNRRTMPHRFSRRVLSLDPAISDRASSDETGFSELGMTEDGHIFVIADHTGTYTFEQWAQKAHDLYIQGECDCVIVEMNRGGTGCRAALQLIGRLMGIDVEVREAEETTEYVPGVMFVKEVYSTHSKKKRAEAVIPLYQRNKVSHVKGSNLDMLETLMCTWEPENSRDSPDRIDALVHGIWELADLSQEIQDNREAFEGLKDASRYLRENTQEALGHVTHLLGSTEWGSGL